MVELADWRRKQQYRYSLAFSERAALRSRQPEWLAGEKYWTFTHDEQAGQTGCESELEIEAALAEGHIFNAGTDFTDGDDTGKKGRGSAAPKPEAAVGIGIRLNGARK